MRFNFERGCKYVPRSYVLHKLTDVCLTLGAVEDNGVINTPIVSFPAMISLFVLYTRDS